MVFERLELGYPLPKPLEDAINALEKGVEDRVGHIDCLQDEVWSCSRMLDNEDDMNKVIDFYCRRRY